GIAGLENVTPPGLKQAFVFPALSRRLHRGKLRAELAALGMWRPDHQVIPLPDFQTIIDVVVSPGISVIETADLLEHFARGHEAGTGNRREVLHRHQPAAMARTGAGKIT